MDKPRTIAPKPLLEAWEWPQQARRLSQQEIQQLLAEWQLAREVFRVHNQKAADAVIKKCKALLRKDLV